MTSLLFDQAMTVTAGVAAGTVTTSWNDTMVTNRATRAANICLAIRGISRSPIWDVSTIDTVNIDNQYVGARALSIDNIEKR